MNTNYEMETVKTIDERTDSVCNDLVYLIMDVVEERVAICGSDASFSELYEDFMCGFMSKFCEKVDAVCEEKFGEEED